MPKEGVPLITLAQVSEKLQKLATDLIATLLDMRDSLLLIEAQVQRLERISTELRACNDTTLHPLAKWIVEHQRQRLPRFMRQGLPQLRKTTRKE